MKCPHCGTWTSVSETREHEFSTTRRRRVCANGHSFYSVEIPERVYKRARANILPGFREVLRVVAKWARDMAIAKDERPAKVLAEEHGIHHSEISKIKARFRRKGML